MSSYVPDGVVEWAKKKHLTTTKPQKTLTNADINICISGLVGLLCVSPKKSHRRLKQIILKLEGMKI